VWALLAVERWYDSLPGCQDTEVRQLLDRAREIQPGHEVPWGGPAGEWI
jgi:putative phosphoribosyl transferase